MKKTVPDPPFGTNAATAASPIGCCDAGHAPIFSVNPGIHIHDALVHVSLYLRAAYDAVDKALEDAEPDSKGLLWANLHSVELAKGLVEALLDGLETAAHPSP